MPFIHITDLPVVRQNNRVQYYETQHTELCAALHDFTAKLEEIEAHMQRCTSCAANPERLELRCLLIQRIAEVNEGIEQVEQELGWAVN